MNAIRSSYRYRPLTEADSIRLLVLQPARDHNEDLHGSLVHTDLKQCDEDLVDSYTALSYVWGDAGRTATVHLSGCAVTITATLAAALRDLRDGTRPRRVWADAVCIDQANTPERNVQVTLMGLIYRLATHTVIYLGPDSADAKTVLDAAPRHMTMPQRTRGDPAGGGRMSVLEREARNITYYGPRHEDTVMESDAAPRSTATEEDARGDLSQRDIDGVLKAASRDILSRPWFRRVWVFQELVLSHSPWVQCGRRRARWPDLCTLLLHTSDWNTSRPGLGMKPLAGFEAARLGALEHMDQAWGEKMGLSIVDILQARRGFGAADARDLVFAHMGVATDRRQASHMVPVDYGMTLRQVFAGIAKYIIATKGFDNLMSLVDEGSAAGRRSEIPSWVPDWTVPRSGTRAIPIRHVQRITLPCFAKAFVESDPAIEGSGVLGRIGVTVGTLAAVSCTLPFSSSPDFAGVRECRKTVSEMVDFPRSDLGRPRAPGEPEYRSDSLASASALYEGLCGEFLQEWSKFVTGLTTSPTDAPNQNQQVSEYLSTACGFDVPYLDIVHAAYKPDRQHLTDISLLCMMQDYTTPGLDHTCNFLEGRRLAVISGTGLLGAVPAQAQQGDLVVNLLGSRVSVILRPTSVDDTDRAAIDGRLRGILGLVSRKPTCERDSPSLTKHGDEGAHEENLKHGYNHDHLWMAENLPVEHCKVIGTCHFDGQRLWRGQVPEKEDVRLYALH